GPGQGSPVCIAQAPALHVSVPLQNSPSLQTDPFGSGAVQVSVASLQDSLQLPSPSGPGQGSPLWLAQAPAAQVSVPLQKRPSLHADPFGSAAGQVSVGFVHGSLRF